MDVYSNIVKLAKKTKKTLGQVEEEAGLGQGIISKWKNGNPTLNNLQAVAKVLNVTVNELLETKSEDACWGCGIIWLSDMCKYGEKTSGIDRICSKKVTTG